MNIRLVSAVATAISAILIPALHYPATARAVAPIPAAPPGTVADTPVDLLATALVMGPSGISIPTDAYLQTAFDTYLQPAGFQGTIDDVSGLWLPNHLGGDTNGSLAGGVDALNAALLPLLQNGESVTLFGYSQSTAVIAAVLNQLGGEYADQLDFVAVGASSTPGGLIDSVYEWLPDWGQQMLRQSMDAIGLTGVLSLPGQTSEYVLDTSLPYDGLVFNLVSGSPQTPWADGYALFDVDEWSRTFESLLGMFSTHVLYMGLQPDLIVDSIASADIVDNGITFIDLVNPESFWDTLMAAAQGVGWL